MTPLRGSSMRTQGLLEGGNLDTRSVIGEQLLNGLAESRFIHTERHVDRDHVAVHMNIFDTLMGEETPSEFVARSVHFRSRGTAITLVPHARDRTVDFKPNNTWIR